jgi:CheY-like chemotaxis protein
LPENNKKKIMIFEDDSITASYIKNFLESNKYHVVGLSNSGNNVIELINEYKPDLILMDIKLKGEIDGIEITRLLQRKYDIPVIYLTAYSDELTVEKAKLTEPAGYLTKPIREKELLISIKMILHNYKMNKLNGRIKKTHKKSSEHRKQDIMYISSKILANNGSENLSIVKIAKELDISSPAIYKHFKSKDELINYLIDNFKQNFQIYYEKMINIDGKGIDRLNNILIEWCEEFENNNPLMNILFSQLTFQNKDNLSKTVNEIQTKNMELIKGVLEDIGENSNVIKMNLDQYAKILIFTVSDTINQWEKNDKDINLYNKINIVKEQISKLLNIY